VPKRALKDFTKGVPISSLRDGEMLGGQIGKDKVLLICRGGDFFAVGSECTHYHGDLTKGLLVGDEVRCPLHHACFDLRTGEALRAPAFDPIPCWRVERIADKVFVRDKIDFDKTNASDREQKQSDNAAKNHPSSVVIIGGGAAGFSGAEMLRRKGYSGHITMVSADKTAPYDRPNLSKDYLSGDAPDEWMPLRQRNFYKQHKIELMLNTRVASIDAKKRTITLEKGKTLEYGALLLATGAEPIKLALTGATKSQVMYLRSYADSKAIIQKARAGKRVIILGASFIALEVAASLRTRKVNVHVVAPDHEPLERVMGPQIGKFVRGLHESHGVMFHLGETITQVKGRKAVLKSGKTLEVDFLVLGVGVKPSTKLAEDAGLKVDNGVLVNEYLESSEPGIFAVGDIANWRDAYSGERLRIEHWVVAERQGQVAAKNMLGLRERYDLAPFFWTAQFGVEIRYAGHAKKWSAVKIDGSLKSKKCAVRFRRSGRTLAVATINRDLKSLEVEREMEIASRK
jgi:NADPH-dependent 2,4-dienoyl-CoA reductase/sulfur reductase-like enzyme/nitrite reductase/ring-hydroxylating ferredoxin subunit